MRESYQAAVISDTHGILRDEVIKVIKGCDVILHGGDFDCKRVFEDLEQMGDSNLEDPYAKATMTGTAPAKCYVDNAQSFSCNEVTVYWNSPLIYLMAANK